MLSDRIYGGVERCCLSCGGCWERSHGGGAQGDGGAEEAALRGCRGAEQWDKSLEERVGDGGSDALQAARMQAVQGVQSRTVGGAGEEGGSRERRELLAERLLASCAALSSCLHQRAG